MNSMEIICESISKTFSGKTIFKDLSFKISSKKSLSVIGKNGSGKSTLIKIISNLIHPSKGKISIQENHTDLPRETWFHKIGLLSPYLNLYDELTGFENLEFFYKLKSSYDNSNNGFEINSSLERVGLYEKRNEMVKNYSSGMKQRLKLIYATMNHPEILLMDEPRTNLDKSGNDLIYKICEEQREKGILIIATNENEDKSHCDEYINLEDYR